VVEEVTITIWFCKDKDPDKCAKYPKTATYFGRATFVINLNEFDEIGEIVEYIMERLRDRYMRSLGNIPDKERIADTWADKVAPYIYEVVFDAVTRYLERLYDLYRMCKEGIYIEREDLLKPIITEYPRLQAELEFDIEAMVCENAERALALVNRYREAIEVTGMDVVRFIKYKLGKLDECRRKVVEPLMRFTVPLEDIIAVIEGADWCYEVYYHA